MAIAGLLFGAFTQPLADDAARMPDEILAVMGGPDGLAAGYLGFMGVYYAIMISVCAVQSIHVLRAEELGSRTESILATGVSRPRWLLSWAGVSALGALWLCLITGVATALTAGDARLAGGVVLGYAVAVAPVWLLLGIAVALYGAAPRLLGAVWVILLGGAFLALFGQMMRLDRTWLNLSPFLHTGTHPAGDVAWGGAGVLAALAVAALAAAVWGFRRRDLRC